MNVPGIDARLLELLQQASNLQLFRERPAAPS